MSLRKLSLIFVLCLINSCGLIVVYLDWKHMNENFLLVICVKDNPRLSTNQSEACQRTCLYEGVHLTLPPNTIFVHVKSRSMLHHGSVRGKFRTKQKKSKETYP